MVEVQCLDGSTVTIDGVPMVGPVHTYAASMSVGDLTCTTGFVQVFGGSGTQTLALTSGEMTLLPFVLCVCFFLGMIWGCFALSHSSR